MENRKFNTGVCEKTHSKRVLVNAISGVKDFLGLPVFTVKGGTVERQSFSGANTVDGCLCLTGAVVEGSSLFDACAGWSARGRPEGFPAPAGFSFENGRGFLSLLRSLVESAIVLRDNAGSLPRLFLNGIYFDADAGTFVYLPPKLAEYLSTYLSEEKRRSVYFVAGGPDPGGPRRNHGSAPTDERVHGASGFARSCVLLLYLFFNRGGEGQDSPVYYLAERIQDFPAGLADLVWNVMHRKSVSLEALVEALGLSLLDRAVPSSVKPPKKVPLRKRRGYLGLGHSLGAFFSSRFKLIILIVILGGVLAYVLLDFAGKRGKPDYSAGLAPPGVVELYYSAMNRLDLDVIQSLFYRRAGREVVNEMSTLFVMSKLGQLYGGQYGVSEGGGPPSILSIQDLGFEQVSGGDTRVFHAHYKKTINTGEKKTEYLIDETLSLRKIGDRWYIVNVESKLVE
jgi:hypothetical protein